MSCSRNDVVLLPIPFTDLTSRKVRPAVVIGRSGVDLFLVPISSQFANADFSLQGWRAAGLNVPCGVKAQIATVEERLVVKTIGTLSAAGQQSLNTRLRAWLGSLMGPRGSTRSRQVETLNTDVKNLLGYRPYLPIFATGGR